MSDSNSKSVLHFEDPSSPKKLSKLPLLIAVIFIIISISLAIALTVVVTHNKKQEQETSDPQVNPQPPAGSQQSKTCTSSGCVQAAGRILEAIDETVDPCHDFYEFACGNWIKKHIIPEDKSSYTTFTKLRDQVASQLKALLEEPQKEKDATALKEVKDMYAACLNEDEIEKLGYQPLYDLLNTLGGWPIITPSWTDDQFDLMTVLSKMRLLNNRYLIDGFVTVDYKNSTNRIFKFAEFGFGLPSREYYLDPNYVKIIQAYRTYMVEVATFLNGTSVEQQVDDILEFETYFANITMSKAEKRDPEATYNKMTIGDMYSNISDEFDWLLYINNLFSNVNYTFDLNDEVVITAPEYYKKVVAKLEETPNRTIANYLLWRLTANRVQNLPKGIQNVKQSFEQVLYGVTAKPARWKTCVDYTNNWMGMATGRLFVNSHFKEEAKSSALGMIAHVRGAFNDLLEDVTWMNDKTRKVAKEKAAAMHENIGYPDWIHNDTRINSEYQGLLGHIDPTKYFENHLNALKYTTVFSITDYAKPLPKHEWGTDPAVVNAYYEGTENQITFPAGILQPPFWQSDQPESLNYGAIGTVIGHEITHGFDDQGRKFDKDGNLLEWWDPEVIAAFNEAKKCIIDQYGRYVVPQLNRTLNGVNTQGENIADNGGIKQSYRAFEKLQEENGQDQRLPGLNYTPNQLFFIGFAQMWCSSARDNSLKLSIEEGAHSPGMFRVIGTLSNFPEFSKQFKCSAGAKMNPTGKCTVW
ncbi:neprilysin-like isoform X2 [Watersipora subatra]|uniref:neprilysin-like isoform X2 n=1 Tax=Watersipora subatra TaxID=2589382 RepID=UPI00355BA65A